MIAVRIRHNPFVLDSGSWFGCGSGDGYGDRGRE